MIDDSNGQYLLLSCKNIKGGYLSFDTDERRINQETFEKLRKRTKLAKGDILLSSVGTVGEMVLLNNEPSNYEFQRSVAMIKADPQFISSEFLYNSLLSQREQIVNAAHGAVQQCLFLSDIADFKTILPTKSIISDFSKITKPLYDKIESNRQECLLLSNLRDSLLPKLMSGELDSTKAML